MRILFFNWRDIRDPLAGGAEEYIHQIGKKLAEKSEVFLYCRRYEGSSHREVIDGITVVRRGGSFSVYLYAFFDYLFKLRKRNFDVVVDGINGVPFFTPLFVRKPKVAVMHHLVGREIFFKELPFPLAAVGWAAEQMIRWVYRRTPMIAVSDSTRDELIEFGIPEKRIRIVNNAIEHRERQAIDKSTKPTFTYLGRIKEYKQLDHLIKTLPRVIAEVPRAELIIAGRGDYSHLASLAGELNVSHSVRFIGEVSEEEKVEVLSRAWVFVTPSMKEGWGITVIEANDCGTPAIGYNVPGLSDSIQDGKTGLLVPSGDIKELAKAIVRVIDDSELRERLSQNARSWAAGFSWDSSAKEFEKVLDGVISGRRTPSVGNSAN
jgi:glycosyltransferase involved in cell wall biosynthesis